ncbi:hypothetical protein HFP43_14210 [Streptomyces sp. SJ1-7]|nr:hypothetical protein [Streptomyces sp. SJ1-7]
MTLTTPHTVPALRGHRIPADGLYEGRACCAGCRRAGPSGRTSSSSWCRAAG